MPEQLTVKFDGGRMAVLGPNRRILGYIGDWLGGYARRVREDAWDEGFLAGLHQGSEGADGPRYTNPYLKEKW